VLQFGTDGVRGDAAVDLTTPLIFALGRAIARVLQPDRVLIGRDTRESGARIEGELAAGLVAEGVPAAQLGVLPTPAIAFVASREDSPAAIVSASHNPWTDNGVKIVGRDGRKLPDEQEAAIEAELRALAVNDSSVPTGGTPTVPLAAADDYIAHLVGALGGRTLGGLSIIIDCANGAAFAVGPRALERAGARVSVRHAEPNGRNINADCGSTYPAALQAAVRDGGAHVGLALDGDADRVIAVDENGEIVDGDQMMTMLAVDFHERGALRNDAIAVTVMSNMGLRRAMEAHGLRIVETPVGDRNVVQAMQAGDLVMGGEQSGHIVFADYATTGDGLLTGLLVADLMRRTRRPLSELAAQMTRYPQVLTNIRVARRVDIDAVPAIGDAVHAVEGELRDRGRVLVRSSGTEPLIRIMVEAETQPLADEAVARLRSVVEAELARRDQP
jgi:phosphoglucosamine mutase